VRFENVIFKSAIKRLVTLHFNLKIVGFLKTVFYLQYEIVEKHGLIHNIFSTFCLKWHFFFTHYKSKYVNGSVHLITLILFRKKVTIYIWWDFSLGRTREWWWMQHKQRLISELTHHNQWNLIWPTKSTN